MTSAFYITEPNEGLYNLRLVSNHLCLSSSRDLNTLLERVASYTKQYKTPEKLERRMKKLNYNRGVKISPEGIKALIKLYERDKDKYNDLIELTVKEALPQKNSTSKSPFKPRKKESGVLIPEETKPVKTALKTSKTAKSIKQRKILLTPQ